MLNLTCQGENLGPLGPFGTDGGIRVRTVATKDRPCTDFPLKSGDDYDPAVLLDLDYWVLMPQ